VNSPFITVSLDRDGHGCIDIGENAAIHSSFDTPLWSIRAITNHHPRPLNAAARAGKNLFLRKNRFLGFLPRCMECSRGIAMGFLSVRLSVKRVHCDKTEESYV